MNTITSSELSIPWGRKRGLFWRVCTYRKTSSSSDST